MSPDLWLAYAAAVTALVLAPGPSVLLVASHGLEHGFSRTVATIGGDLSANLLQMICAGAGLGALLQTSQAALWVLKWGGAAYLAYLGVRHWAAPGRRPSAGGEGRPGRSERTLFAQGFAVSAFNPKAILFFVGLFPAFLEAERAIGPQLLVLGATFLLLDGLALSAYAGGAQRLRRRLRVLSDRRRRSASRLSGTLLLAAAAFVAVKR